jgi:replication factor A1
MGSDLSETAKSLCEQIADDDVGVDQIEDQLETVMEYGVSVDEAANTVLGRYETADDGPSNKQVDAADIPDEGDDSWISVVADVVILWSSEASADSLPTLEEGKAYRFEGVVTDEYQGNYSVNINSSTDIESVDKSFDTDSSQSLGGAIVSIKDGSGLIKRCPEEDCSRTLNSGRCADHGSVDGEFDLRIKAVLDDGTETYDLVMNDGVTEDLTGVTMEEAQKIAKEELDRSAVADLFEEQLVGEYLQVAADPVYGLQVVQSIEDLDEPTDPEEVLIRARSTAVTEDALPEASS